MGDGTHEGGYRQHDDERWKSKDACQLSGRQFSIGCENRRRQGETTLIHLCMLAFYSLPLSSLSLSSVRSISVPRSPTSNISHDVASLPFLLHRLRSRPLPPLPSSSSVWVPCAHSDSTHGWIECQNGRLTKLKRSALF